MKELSLGFNWILTMSASTALDTPCRRNAGSALRPRGCASCSCRFCSRSSQLSLTCCRLWVGWGQSQVIQHLEGSTQSCIRYHRGVRHRSHLCDRLVHHTCLESDWRGSPLLPGSVQSFAATRTAWSSLASFALRRNPFLSSLLRCVILIFWFNWLALLQFECLNLSN